MLEIKQEIDRETSTEILLDSIRTRIKRMRLVSRILGWLLAWVGGLMVLGFLFFELHGGSARPFWIDALTILVVGMLPLCGGIQLLRRRYEALKNSMRLICIGGVAAFALCSMLHLIFPDFAAPQLGVIAGEGLIGAILSGVVWLTAWTRWHSRQQRQAI